MTWGLGELSEIQHKERKQQRRKINTWKMKTFIRSLERHKTYQELASGT
jgi:hypothetical protein